MPELVEELREEIRCVLAENDGIPTTGALQHMKKLDSFLKEVLRIYPATMGKKDHTASPVHGGGCSHMTKQYG